MMLKNIFIVISGFVLTLNSHINDSKSRHVIVQNCQNNPRSGDTSGIIRIPVIFHVLHTNARQNLPTDSLLKELENVRKDFLLLNQDTSIVPLVFKQRIGKPNILFFLADTLLEGQAEKGIIRKAVSHNRNHLFRKSPVIHPERFLNVYVGNIGTDGFVYTKPWEDPTDDAIYLKYEYIGSRYRLLTHEIGHWLGLWHIFEDGCKGDGDAIDDTPAQRSATDGDCETCPPVASDRTCGTTPSNYNNFMDYSGCRVMFTAGQAAKMRSVIFQHRPGFRVSLSDR